MGEMKVSPDLSNMDLRMKMIFGEKIRIPSEEEIFEY